MGNGPWMLRLEMTSAITANSPIPSCRATKSTEGRGQVGKMGETVYSHQQFLRHNYPVPKINGYHASLMMISFCFIN